MLFAFVRDGFPAKNGHGTFLWLPARFSVSIFLFLSSYSSSLIEGAFPLGLYILAGIQEPAVLNDFKMAVVTGRIPCPSYQRDLFPLADLLPAGHQQSAAMGISGFCPIRMVYQHIIPITPGPACKCYRPILCGPNGSPCIGRNIIPCMAAVTINGAGNIPAVHRPDIPRWVILVGRLSDNIGGLSDRKSVV